MARGFSVTGSPKSLNMSPEIRAAKAESRRLARLRLGAVSPAERESWSGRIRERLRSAPIWGPGGGTVALFGGLASEPDLLPLLPWLRERGWGTAFFAIGPGNELEPRLVPGEEDLVVGPMGVLEPAVSRCAALDPAALDVVLAPGLAFGRRDGARLGRGRGFYDRLLARTGRRTRSIGVCFALQILAEVPSEPHDARMAVLVSEEEWREIPGSAAGR